MKKFGVFSGFLGSGKTTTMIALTQYFSEHHGKAAMISNDLGCPGLADYRLAKLSGCHASELTGACICYQTENLVNRLEQLYSDGCQLVLSDIPGFGIGALDHVYHTLNNQFPGQFPLTPFTVLCEPHTVSVLRESKDQDLCYILKSQLLEADLILLNKCDLLTPVQKEQLLMELSRVNPQADILAISALTGEGMEELSQALIHRCASLRKPDLDYGGEVFQSAIGKISEYNLQYHAIVCCDCFDGTQYLKDMAETVSAGIQQAAGEIPHMKLLAWNPEGDYGKVDLLGTGRPVVVTKAFQNPCTDLAVVFNASAFCGKDTLDQILSDALQRVSKQYQLTVTVYKKECFAAMGGS